tara:strand:- start:713 stop:898 length:186 start_codon:yes stop_codon:yes gene_type:complete
MLVVLESVGSVLNTKQGIIYPQNENGSYDKNFSISLVEDEVNAEWYKELSTEDYELVKPFL